MGDLIQVKLRRAVALLGLLAVATVSGATPLFAQEVTVTDAANTVTASIIVDAGAPQVVGQGETTTLAALVTTLNPELTSTEVNWGDGVTDTPVPASTGVLAPTHIYADLGEYQVTIAVTGPFGDTGSDTTSITVIDAPPEVDAGGPYTGNVGEGIVLSAMGFDSGGGPVSYAWTLSGDAAFDDFIGQTVFFSATAVGTFTVAVEATDDSGQTTVDTATVIVIGPATGASDNLPTTPQVAISPVGSITATEGEIVYIEALVTGSSEELATLNELTFFIDGVILTMVGPSDGYEFPQFTYVLGVPMPQVPVSSTTVTLAINATVTDSSNARGTSETLNVAVSRAKTHANDDRAPGDLGSSSGKIAGRAVIGTILRLDASEIWVAADLSAVRVHIDPNATELASDLGAEAFAVGNRVVVIEDGNATAIKITPIPTKAQREHKRVLIVKSDADDTAKVVDEDGEDLGQADATDVDAEAGDQVVVIVRSTNGGSGRKEVKVVSTTKDVSERLDEIAQKRFDAGELTDSADVDNLRDENRAKDEERVAKIAERTDGDDGAGAVVKEAVEKANAKIKVDPGEADPIKAIRKETASKAASEEHTIAECASELLGRKISRKADVTPGEAERVQAECIGDDGGPVGDAPPPEVIECAERVLGRTLDGPISDEEKALVAGECAGIGGGSGENRGEPSPDVLKCIEKVLGRPLDQNLTEEELAKIDAACGAPEDGGGRDGGPGGAPPAEVIECIERVLGRPFDGQATADERAKFEQECQGVAAGGGGDPGQVAPPNVLECIENVLGRPLDGSVTPDERAKFDEVCGAPAEGARDDAPAADRPPPEIAACVERVLGRSADGPVSEEEKTKISEECVGLGGPSEPPPPSDVLVCAEEALGHKIDGPISDDEAENIRQSCAPPENHDGVAPPPGRSDEANKQVAFCDANPNDAHCENFVPPHDGDQPLPPLDGEGGGKLPIDDELAKLCAENPRDAKCGDAVPPPPPPDDELAKLCAENPRDAKCSGDATPPPPPPEDELAKLCAENPQDAKCGGDATPPPPPPPEDGDEKHTLSPEQELKELCAAKPSDPQCVS